MVFRSHLQSKHTDSGTSPARLDAAPSCRQPEGFVRRPHGGKHPGHDSAVPSVGTPVTQHHLPRKASGQIFSPLTASACFVGPGYKDSVCYAPERWPEQTLQSAEPPCREQRLLRGRGKARHSCRAEAPSASGATRDPRPGLGQSPRLACSLHPSALCYTTQQARLGNDIIVPNVYSVCWDFTGDDKRAQHLALETYNRKLCCFPHFKNICYELMIQLIPTITGAEEKRLAEHPIAHQSLLLFLRQCFCLL